MRILLFLFACSLLISTNGPAAKLEKRIVALGDIHGDLAGARKLLKLAGAIDANDHWAGGKLIVVQVGDQIDRGPQDKEVLDLFTALAKEASTAGGAVHSLLGNHEAMNAYGDFRYVDPEELAGKKNPFAEFGGREKAFKPGGAYAKILAERNTALILEGTIFVHGGITELFSKYGVEKINQEMKAWLSGRSPPPAFVRDNQGPLWSRDFSDEGEAAVDCVKLQKVLKDLGVKRMVVAHTIQKKLPGKTAINSKCDGGIWRIDAGLVYGDSFEILEVIGDKIKPLYYE